MEIYMTQSSPVNSTPNVNYERNDFSSLNELTKYVQDTFNITLTEAEIPISYINHSNMTEVLTQWAVYKLKNKFAISGLIDSEETLDEGSGQTIQQAGLRWVIIDSLTGEKLKESYYIDDWYHAIGKGRSMFYLEADMQEFNI